MEKYIYSSGLYKDSDLEFVRNHSTKQLEEIPASEALITAIYETAKNWGQKDINIKFAELINTKLSGTPAKNIRVYFEKNYRGGGRNYSRLLACNTDGGCNEVAKSLYFYLNDGLNKKIDLQRVEQQVNRYFESLRNSQRNYLELLESADAGLVEYYELMNKIKTLIKESGVPELLKGTIKISDAYIATY